LKHGVSLSADRRANVSVECAQYAKHWIYVRRFESVTASTTHMERGGARQRAAGKLVCRAGGRHELGQRFL